MSGRNDGSDRRPPVDGGRLAVATLVGAAGVLFLLEPVVGTITLGGVMIRPVGLSVLVLVAGLVLGGVVFLRRGFRLFGLGHLTAGLGFGLFTLGLLVAWEPLVIGGVLVVIGGTAAVAALSGKQRRA